MYYTQSGNTYMYMYIRDLCCLSAAAIFQPVKKYLFIPAKLSAPCPQIQAEHKYISVLLSAFFSRASNFPIRINKSHDWLFTWFDTDRAASHFLPTILASASTLSPLQCQLSVLRDFGGILSHLQEHGETSFH